MRVKEEHEKAGLNLNNQKTKIMASGPITSGQIDGKKVGKEADFIFLSSKITVEADCSHKIKRHLFLERKAMTNLDSILKSSNITLPTNARIVKAMVFFCSCIQMWELDHKEGWAPKNWCFWIPVVKTHESPLDSKIKPVNPKGNQPWIFTGRTDAEAEPPPDAKRWFTEKDPEAGKDWGQEQKGTAEDELVGWHHWLNGYESDQILGDSEGQGSLVCCRPWSCRVGLNLATEQQQQV